MTLRSIATAVAGWSRGHAGVPDRRGPLDAIAAEWPAIVGAEVARNCAPLELAGTTLVVATRSSAWSQQLQFLEARVLAGVQAIPSTAHVKALRFRSGGLAPRARAVAFGRTATVRKRPQAEVYEPARDLDEALARLRTRFAAARPAGPVCERCRVSLQARPARVVLCALCEEETTRERVVSAQRRLYETPWLGRDTVLDAVPGLTNDEYDRARYALLGRWWATLERARRAKKLSPDRLERRIATSYVILQSRLPPDRISSAVVQNVLGEELAALLFGAPGGEGRVPPEPPRTDSKPSAAKTSRRE